MELRQDLPRRRALRLLLPAAAALAPLASCAPRRTPPPEPAVAALQAPTSDRAYIVFFELGSAAVGPRGRQIVAEAARSSRAQGNGPGRIELQAYADRSGRPDYNLRLSRRRAEAVADELARQGVPRDRIAIQAHGESRPLVPTRDGEREGQNRGVWIVLR